jgi:hypothetical protein
MNGRGDAVALWVHGSDAGTELVAAHRAGGTWQAPVVISPMGTSQVLVNTAVMNDAGAVAVAFSSNLRDREHRTYAVTYTPGRSWSAPVGLSRPGRNAGFSDDDRAVAIDRDGRVLAAWTEPEGDDYVVSIRHFDRAAASRRSRCSRCATASSSATSPAAAGSTARRSQRRSARRSSADVTAASRRVASAPRCCARSSIATRGAERDR